MFSIGVGDERAYLMSSLEFICSPLETHKIRIHTMLFPEPKVRQRKFKCAKILSKTSGENYSLSEVADVVPRCCETISFASGIFNELSRLFHSTLETCLNSFQNSIPFLSRKMKLMKVQTCHRHSNPPS